MSLRGILLICHTVPFVGSLPPPGGLDRLRAFSLPFLACWGGGVSFVAYRAQLGRVGGSPWVWVLQIKYRAIQTNVSLFALRTSSLSAPAGLPLWASLSAF